MLYEIQGQRSRTKGHQTKIVNTLKKADKSKNLNPAVNPFTDS